MPKITTVTPRDRALLEGLLSADPARVRDIYDEVLPSVQYYIRNNGGDADQARDVFQDALMALYKRVSTEDFALTCSLKSYLRVVARNLWLKRLRRAGREGGGLPTDWEPVDLDDRMDARLERAEREALLWRHFDALGEACRAVLRAFFAGDSMRAIAKRMDTSEGYIKKRKHQCKERLVRAVRADAQFSELSAEDFRP